MDISLKFDTGAGVVIYSFVCTTLGLLLNACLKSMPGERERRKKWESLEKAYKAAEVLLGKNQPKGKGKVAATERA